MTVRKKQLLGTKFQQIIENCVGKISFLEAVFFTHGHEIFPNFELFVFLTNRYRLIGVEISDINHWEFRNNCDVIIFYLCRILQKVSKHHFLFYAAKQKLKNPEK